MKTTFTLQTQTEVAGLYRDGKKAKYIAELYGITMNQVYGIVRTMRRNGMIVPLKHKFSTGTHRSHTKRTQSEKDEIAKLYAEGVSTKKICSEYKITKGTLYVLMSDMKVKRTKKDPRTPGILPSVKEVEKMVHPERFDIDRIHRKKTNKAKKTRSVVEFGSQESQLPQIQVPQIAVEDIKLRHLVAAMAIRLSKALLS